MAEDFGTVEDFGVSANQAEDFGEAEDFGAIEEPSQPSAKGDILRSAKAAGSDFLAAADTILGTVGGVINLGLTGATDVIAALSGDETPFKAGREATEQGYGSTKIGKFLAKPIEYLSDNEQAMKSTLLNETFSYLGEQLSKAGEAIGGGETAEATGQAVELALTVLGAKALKGDLKRLKEASDIKGQSIDDLMGEYDNFKANQPKPQLVNQDELPFTNDIADARTPEFSQLADEMSPTKQDELDFTNRKPDPNQKDMFEPEANEQLEANKTGSIETPNTEPYSFPIKNQDYIKLEVPTKASTPEISKAADVMIEEAPLDAKLLAKPIEELSDHLTKEEWTKEFLNRHPDRDVEAADFAYQRLQPEKAYNVTLGEAADDFLKLGFGTFFTRLGNLDESLLQKSLNYEQRLLQRPHEIYKKMDTVFDEVKKFPPKLQDDLEAAFKSKDKDAIYKAFAYAGKPELFKTFETNVLKTVEDLGKEGVTSGALKGLKDDYFLPAVVKDYNGLLKAMGKSEELPKIEQELKTAAQKAYAKGERFGEVERTAVINKFVRGYPKPDAYKAGYRKERKFDVIPEEFRKYYHPTQDALHMYVKNASDDIETFNFLGRNVKKDVDGKVNLQDSIGAHIDDLMRKGMAPEKADELRELYTARFVGGNRSPNKAVQTTKNLASGLLLSGLSSTALQIAELIPLIALSQPQMINGLKGALKTAVSSIKAGGHHKLDARDLGLVDHYMNTEVQRYVGKGLGTKFANGSAALADATLKLNFFKQSDIALKSFNLNTQLAGAEYQLATPKGRRLFADDWKARFGDDLPQLMQELKAGKITPLTTNYAFSQLAKTQAISKGNWTTWSLNNPNARLFTTLKTFAINQLQMIQSEGIRKIKRGDRAEGIKSLAKVAVALTLGGAASTEIRDFVMGREGAADKLGKVGLAMMKVVGLQDRTVKEFQKGNIGKAAVQYILPPLEMFDRPLSDALKELRGEESSKSYIDLLPGGREFRSRFMGGAEEYNENQQNRNEE